MKITIKRGLLGVGGAVLVYAAVALLRPSALVVETAPVTRRPLQLTVDEEGETRVRDRYVVAAPVVGRVARIALREGDEVRNGGVVARVFPVPLDPRARAEARAQLDAAEDAQRAAATAVMQARLAQDQAYRARQRAERMALENAIATADREQAELEQATRARDLESAEFRAQAAAHDVEMARAALVGGTGPVEIRSPVAGRVLRVYEPSERVVSAGAPLVEIGDPSRLEIVADLLSTDAVRVPAGARVLIVGWGGDTLRGRVRLVEPSAFTKVSALGVDEQRVNVIADFVDSPGSLADRYRVELRVVIWQSDSVLAVPASALFRQGDGWAVFVTHGGTARLRTVLVGHRTAFDAEVLRGLEIGDVVIRHPSDRVTEGVRVAERP